MFSGLFKDLRVMFSGMQRDFEQMEKDLEGIDEVLEKVDGKVNIQREVKSDGTVVVTKTTVYTPQAKKEEPKADKPRTLEDELWKNVYSRLKDFWVESTTILFDGKHYTIGFFRDYQFHQRGFGDSIEIAVKDVERKFDRSK